VGARIRELRRGNGWTQDEFADLSGLHRAQVGAFENGRMNMTLASLHLVAQTLGVRILDLLIDVEEAPKSKKAFVTEFCCGRARFQDSPELSDTDH
jgi:transcriptional regulator with XRE-family HTH domain